ncbi:helix-turn-helix domain-containing protein [Thauera aromatica]|nr:helix-turn-helix domain-containing protein [Thauera aromatica]MCK2126563.1 helix-turn-helix domain-containing protein [Thauera aromatica]
MAQTRASTDIPPLPSRASQQLTPLLDKATLCKRLNISPRTIENMVKDGSFPPPVRVGKYVYWTEASVQSWQRRLFAAQEAWTGH